MAVELEDRVEDRLEQFGSHIGRLQTSVEHLQTDVSQLRTGVGKLQSDVTQLQTSFGKLQSDVTHLQTDVTDIKADAPSGTRIGTQMALCPRASNPTVRCCGDFTKAIGSPRIGNSCVSPLSASSILLPLKAQARKRRQPPPHNLP